MTDTISKIANPADDINFNTKQLRRRLNGLFAMLAAMKVMFILLNLFAGPLIRLIFGDRAEDVASKIGDTSNISAVLFNILLNVLFIGLPTLIWFLCVRRHEPVKQIIMNDKPTFLSVICSVGVTMLVTYIVQFSFVMFWSTVSEFFGLAPEDTSMNLPSGAVGFILMAICIAVMPALFEELAMRGAFIGGTKKWGPAFAVVLSSVCFSMLHNTIMQLPFALAAGLMMGYFAVRFNSIKVSVISHFCINFSSCLLSYIIAPLEKNPAFIDYVENQSGSYEAMTALISSLQESGDLWRIPAMFVYFALLVCFVTVATVLFFVKFGVKGLGVRPQLKANRLKAVLTCPFMYIFAALSLAFTIYNLIGLM